MLKQWTTRVTAGLMGAGLSLALAVPCRASAGLAVAKVTQPCGQYQSALPCGQVNDLPSRSPFDGVAPADATVLEATRGGFTLPDGLTVSLGIERLVLLNGEVIAHSSLQIANLARLDVAEARQASTALSSVNLVRNGPHNMNSALMAAAIGGTVIQNTLNDQHIDTRTVISSTVNSVGMLTTRNFQGSLSDALAQAVLPH